MCVFNQYPYFYYWSRSVYLFNVFFKVISIQHKVPGNSLAILEMAQNDMVSAQIGTYLDKGTFFRKSVIRHFL